MGWVPYEPGSPHMRWEGAWPVEDESIVIDETQRETIRTPILKPTDADEYDWMLREDL